MDVTEWEVVERPDGVRYFSVMQGNNGPLEFEVRPFGEVRCEFLSRDDRPIYLNLPPECWLALDGFVREEFERLDVPDKLEWVSVNWCISMVRTLAHNGNDVADELLKAARLFERIRGREPPGQGQREEHS